MVQFGPFEMDRQTGAVRKYGLRIKLAGQPLEVLQLLIERAGQLVTREELKQRLWPEDVFVDFERSLNSAVKKLRAALSDNPDEPRYVETYPRKGYKFIGEIIEIESPVTADRETTSAEPLSEPIPANQITDIEVARPWYRVHWVGVALAVVLFFIGSFVLPIRHRAPSVTPTAPVSKGPNVRSSIAILGFKNLSSQHEGGWLATAIAQMLTTELQTGGKLRIIRDESVSRAKAHLELKESEGYPRDTLRELYKDLASDYIVAGSYVALGGKESGQVRIDIRLQETISGETLASVAVSGEQSQIFDLVGKAGRELRSKVGTTIGPEGDRDWRGVLPSNPDAARLYSQALEFMWVDNNVSASESLQQCLVIDPEFALAHAALAQAWLALGYDARAQASAQKALSLASSLPENVRLKIEGQYYETQHDWTGAVLAYGHLFKDYPDDLEAGLKLADTQVSSENISDASSTISSLRSLDTPQHQDPRIDLVESLAASRRSDYKAQQELAESAAKKAHATGARLLWARAKMQEGWALDDQTQTGGALKAYREAQPVFEAAGDSDHAATLLDDIGIVLQEQGDLKGAEATLQEAQRRFREIGDQKGLGASLTNLGQLYHAQGDLTSAVELYREAINIFHKNARTDNENAAMNNLGGVLFERGDFREAEKIYQTLLQVREKQGDKSGVAYAKSNLAAALWVRGKLDESATLLEEALRTFQEIGDRFAATAAEAGYARVLISKRDFSAARRALSQAAKISQDINSKGDAAAAQILLAQVAFSEGHPQQVDEAGLRSAIEDMHLQQRGGDEMEGLAIEIQVLLAKGKTDEAQQILTRAEQIQNTTWLANYRLSLASAEIDAKQGKTNISRREVQSQRSKAEKAGCGACELDARAFPSKAQVQNRALTARQLF